jgi:uncharacterized BrkB/YihY/UPF0761 family membrane protein
LDIDGYNQFGIGLAGLFFFYLSSFTTLIILIPLLCSLTNLKTKYGQHIVKGINIVALITLLFITYYFTLGRAHKKPWNRTILNP